MMLKSFLVAFVALATMQTADGQSTKEYLPMQNPGSGKCIVKGACSSDKSLFAIKLGSCTDKNVARLRHPGKGKEIRTSDKFCLDTKTTADSKTGAEIVLRKCPSKCTSKSMLWTKVGRNQWQNGNKLCMEYSTKAKKFIQCPCSILATNDKTSYQQWKFVKSAPPPPPPPPPAQISCAEWGKKWVCGNGWVLNTNQGLTCVGATGSACADVCCRPATTCKSEGFNARSCPPDYQFANRQCSNPGQPRCTWKTCCDYVPPPPPPPRVKTCKSEGYANVCPADYTFVNVECGNRGQPKCSIEVCCSYTPAPIKCTRWNRCSRGWELKPRANDIFCVRGPSVPGPGYAPTCADEICCDRKPVEPVPTTCGRWNRCDAGYVLNPDTKYDMCHTSPNPPFTGPNAAPPCSNDLCCKEKFVPPPPPPPPKPEYEATTCGAWDACDKGYELWTSPFNRKCYVPGSAGTPPSSVMGMCTNEYCCLVKPPATPPTPPSPPAISDPGTADTVPPATGEENGEVVKKDDTCKLWSERVVEEPLTGAEVCAQADKWAGLMDSADEKFEQPCVEDGKKVECSAKMCCVSL